MGDYLSKHQGSTMDEADDNALTALQPEDIVDDIISTDTLKPLSANMGKTIWDKITTNFNNTLQLNGTQSVSGTKTFSSLQYFLNGFEIPTGKFGVQYSQPTSALHLVNKAYADAVSLQSENGGAGVSVTMGTVKKISLDLADLGGLKFSDTGDNGELQVDINGLPNTTYPNNTDELIIYDTVLKAFRKVTRQNFLGAITSAITFKGTWNPTTNTVSGDDLNTSLHKDTAPVVLGGDDPIGNMYIVSTPGIFDINGDSTEEALYATDQVIWMGDEWAIISATATNVKTALLSGESTTLASIPLSLGQCMKVAVNGYDSAGDVHSVEVLLSAKGTSDSFLVEYAEIRSNGILFTLTAENDATNLSLNANALVGITITSVTMAIL